MGLGHWSNGCLALWTLGDPCNARDDFFMGLHSRDDRGLRSAEDLQVSERRTHFFRDTP
jgi:hypothetical protein